MGMFLCDKAVLHGVTSLHMILPTFFCYTHVHTMHVDHGHSARDDYLAAFTASVQASTCGAIG